MFKSQLMSVTQKHIGKKRQAKAEKTGISKYLCDDTSSESDDEFADDGEDDAFKTLDKNIANSDNTQLIDLELVNLLKFC